MQAPVKIGGPQAPASVPAPAKQVDAAVATEAVPAPPAPPAPAPLPPGATTSAVFGDSESYHLGDGDYSDSRPCPGGSLKINPTAGKTYVFNFTVLSANTVVNVSINRICGIDYQDHAALIQNGTPLVSLPMGPQYNGSALAFPAQTLAPGPYELTIRSVSDDGDYDDFIVGDIRVEASQAIVQGQASAQ